MERNTEKIGNLVSEMYNAYEDEDYETAKALARDVADFFDDGEYVNKYDMNDVWLILKNH